jgi:hypothetical protein
VRGFPTPKYLNTVVDDVEWSIPSQSIISIRDMVELRNVNVPVA